MIELQKDTTKRLLAVHGWTGTLLGVFLYIVILTGTVAVLASEIGRWSVGGVSDPRPFSEGVQERFDELAVDIAPDYLDEIQVLTNSAGHVVYFFHTHAMNESGEPDDIGRMIEIDPQSGDIVLDREGFGSELFGTDPLSALDAFIIDLHVNLHIPDPWGVYATGILGLIMFLAAGTGLLTHRHLLKDLFVPARYTSALLQKRDRHILAGSWSLPFAFVLAFTGAFYSFALALGFPVVTKTAFAGDRVAMIETLIGARSDPDPTPAVLIDLDSIILRSTERAGTVPNSLTVSHYGRADSTVSVFHDRKDGSLNTVTLVYSAVTGAFIQDKPFVGTQPSAGSVGYTLMSSLHFGTFAGLLSKLTWLGLGLAASYVTVSGMRLWIQRRRKSALWRRFEAVVTIFTYGTPIALLGAGVGFFLAFASSSQQFWTPVAFSVFAIASLLVGGVISSEDKRRRTLILGMAIGMVFLPCLRLATVGGGYGLVGVFDPVVVLLDLLLIGPGLVIIWQTLKSEFKDRALGQQHGIAE